MPGLPHLKRPSLNPDSAYVCLEAAERDGDDVWQGQNERRPGEALCRRGSHGEAADAMEQLDVELARRNWKTVSGGPACVGQDCRAGPKHENKQRIGSHR